MKIPTRILGLARGPVLATAALACSSSASSGPTADPVPPPVPEVAEAERPEPVDYDAAREADRLSRTDALFAAREERRSRRIADEDEARHRRAVLAARELRHMRRCGRG